MASRFSARDHLGALVDLGRVLVRCRFDVVEVRAELQREVDAARDRARFGDLLGPFEVIEWCALDDVARDEWPFDDL